MRKIMRHNNPHIVEEEGVVIYDETDDQFDNTVKFDDDNDIINPNISESSYRHDPNIVEGMYLGGIIKDKSGYRLKENEEIFTDEYMRKYDRYITEKAKKEKRQNLLISIGVIAVCVLGIIGITALVFWLRA